MRKLFFLIAIITFCNCKEKPETQASPTHSHKSKSIKLESSLNNLEYASNIDLYCRMDIVKYGVSDTLTYKGKLYGFCATMCKEQFLKNPEYFLKK